MISERERLRAEYADREQRLSGSNIYSIFNPSNLYMRQQRQRAVLRTLQKSGFSSLKEKSILEIGCGSGGVLQEFLSFGASPHHLAGCDLLPKGLGHARRTLPAHVSLACADGQALPYRSRSFDLLLQYTAFSSVLDDGIKASMAREMLRVIKPGGMILWYDFWLNPTNKQTRGIRPTEIKRLFPRCRFEFQRITLAPPIARRLVSLSWGFCLFLESLKLLNTHYLVTIFHRVDHR